MCVANEFHVSRTLSASPDWQPAAEPSLLWLVLIQTSTTVGEPFGLMTSAEVFTPSPLVSIHRYCALAVPAKGSSSKADRITCRMTNFMQASLRNTRGGSL